VEIVLCDDHRLLAELVSAVLSDAGHAVSIVATPRDAVREVNERTADVCVMDLGFPTEDDEPDVTPIDAIHDISSHGCRVLVLSGSNGTVRRDEALEAGAESYLLKDEPIMNVVKAVENPGDVRVPPDPEASRRTGPPTGPWNHASLAAFLTPRERSVLEGLVQGESTALLARRLGVRPATARTHVQNLLGKLCVHSRLEAVALAVEHGVVRIAEEPA
jgi:DNA-binding NarL/FixJ family response regulator